MSNADAKEMENSHDHRIYYRTFETVEMKDTIKLLINAKKDSLY